VGLEVRAILAVVDLDLGARETLAGDGCDVHSVADLPAMLPLLEHSGYLPPAMRATVEAWHAAIRRST
jgi:orotate phosphoribosyltransferase